MKYCYVRYFIDEETKEVEKEEVKDPSALTKIIINKKDKDGSKHIWRLAIELPHGHFVCLGDLPNDNSKFDFYSIQKCDGNFDWGLGNWVLANFQTLDECIDYIIKNKLCANDMEYTTSSIAIVKQCFGEFSDYDW